MPEKLLRTVPNLRDVVRLNFDVAAGRNGLPIESALAPDMDAESRFAVALHDRSLMEAVAPAFNWVATRPGGRFSRAK